MFLSFKDNYKITQLRRKQKKIKKAYNIDIQDARLSKKKQEEIESIKATARFENDMLEEEILEIVTNNLIFKSRKKIIPLPDYNDDTFWKKPFYIGRNRLLTERGISHLKSQLRKENQTWLKQNIVSIIAVVIAGSSAFFSYTQSEIAKASMKYANRPYLIVSGIKQLTNNGFGFSISNFGKSPSYYTKIYYDTFIADSSFVPPNSFSKVNNSIPIIGGNTKGALTKANVGHVFHYDTLQVLESKHKVAFVAGKIEYMDIFNDKHGYFFCFIKSTDPGTFKFKDYNFAY